MATQGYFCRPDRNHEDGDRMEETEAPRRKGSYPHHYNQTEWALGNDMLPAFAGLPFTMVMASALIGRSTSASLRGSAHHPPNIVRLCAKCAGGRRQSQNRDCPLSGSAHPIHAAGKYRQRPAKLASARLRHQRHQPENAAVSGTSAAAYQCLRCSAPSLLRSHCSCRS